MLRSPRRRASADRRVLVVGDIIADEFIYGQIARVSREAPVLILKYDATEMVAGGAGNAANNVAALGGRARLAGIVGARRRGTAPGVEPAVAASTARHIVRGAAVSHAGEDADPRRRHPFREAAGRADRSRHRLAAVDDGAAARSRAKLAAALGDCDAVLLSDYGSGLVTPALAERIRAARSRGDEPAPVPILVDSRYRLLDYRGMTTCTPNESEVEQMLGVRIDDDPEALERAGREVLRRTRMQAPCWSRAAAAAWRCSSRSSRRCTFRSSDPTKSPTSPARATPSSPPFALALAAGGRSMRRRGSPTTPAAWS